MWSIVPQMEKDNEVLIKQVRFAPVTNKQTGEVSFIPLKMTIFKVVVSNGHGDHSLTWNAKNNTFVWRQPDRLQHPKMKDGCKIMRNNFGREYHDTLADKVKVSGERESFATVEDFAKHLVRVVGNDLTSQILGLFASAIMAKAA